MALARLNLVIQDDDGTIVDGCSISAQNETTLAFPQLYSDRDGSSALGNPFTASDGSNAGFFVVGGAYKVIASLGAFSRTWRYVGVGLMGEQDSLSVSGSVSGNLAWTGTHDFQNTTNTDAAGTTGAVNVAGGVSVRKDIFAEGTTGGGMWIGSGSGHRVMTVNGGSSGTGNGATYQTDLGGSLGFALGNVSAIFSGAYDNTTCFASTHGWKWTTGAGSTTPLFTAGTIQIGSTGTVSSYADGQIPATATNDSAAAGKVGELLSSNVASGSAVSLTTNTPANITSISLTAGDWDVWGSVSTLPNGSTTQSTIKGSISTTSATHPTLPNEGGTIDLTLTFTTGFGQTLPVGTRRISVASTTTVFLVITVSFAASTNAGYGFIAARRRR